MEKAAEKFTQSLQMLVESLKLFDQSAKNHYIQEEQLETSYQLTNEQRDKMTTEEVEKHFKEYYEKVKEIRERSQQEQIRTIKLFKYINELYSNLTNLKELQVYYTNCTFINVNNSGVVMNRIAKELVSLNVPDAEKMKVEVEPNEVMTASISQLIQCLERHLIPNTENDIESVGNDDFSKANDESSKELRTLIEQVVKKDPNFSL